MKTGFLLPATTANLGPGFDCLGLSLGKYNKLYVEPADKLSIEIRGTGSDHITCGENNLSLRALKKVFDLYGRPYPQVKLIQDNTLPVSGGLGSSATAIIGGALAGNYLLDNALPDEALLQIATEIEGHPDNVTPCLLGGITVSAVDNGKVVYLRGLPHESLKFAVAIPSFGLNTQKSRGVLPETYSRKDTCTSISRAIMMYNGLISGDADILSLACQDVLHQPYRAPLIKGWDEITQAARDYGACAVFLSGAGPCIMSVYQADSFPEKMKNFVASSGLPYRIELLVRDTKGARKLEESEL